MVRSRRRWPRHRSTAALFLALLCLLSIAGPAGGQAEDEGPPTTPAELLFVDATGDPYALVRSAERPSDVAVRVDGETVDSRIPVSVHDTDLAVQTVLVIDNSAESSEFLDDFTAAAIAYVEAAPADERIAVWTTGGEGRLRVGANSPRDRTLRILDGIVAASGPNHLWDGVRGAALSFVAPVPGATNIVVLTANIDGGSVNTDSLSRGSVIAAHAAVFLVHAQETESASEARLVDVSSGGAYLQRPESSTLSGVGAELSEAVASTWSIAFSGEIVKSGRSLEIELDDQVVRGSYLPGAVTSGRALDPVPVPGSTTIPGLGFLSGETGRRLGLALGIVAAALGAYSLAMLFQKDDSSLDDILQAYSDSPVTNGGDEGAGGGRSFAKNLFVRRAVEITEGLAKRQGTLERAEAMLERANIPLRAGEALTAYAAIVFAMLALGLLLGSGLIGGLVLGVVGILAPPAVINFRASRRKKAFVAQLPDTLQLLASTLKAGYSFMQGVEAVSNEIEDPMGGELRRIVTEAQLGRPLEDAMDAAAVRLDSEDFAWAVMAVKIQREVGGNLSELLMTVGDTMTARERLRRDVASLTAEGKMSAIVLGVLPILLGAAMWVMNQDYINTLFTNTLGKILLGVSITAALIGFAWMKKIIDIEI